MIYRYGNYSHAIEESEITVDKKSIVTDLGVRIGYTETHRISGILHGSSYSDLNQKILALQKAYSFNARDSGLYLPDGSTRTHIFLRSADCMGGTRVSLQPSFPVGKGAELSTFRTYTIEVTGDVLETFGNPLMNWSETFDYTGTGGPEYVYHIPLEGEPIRHQVTQRSLKTITQKGSAVGLRSYPNVPAPLLPSVEEQQSRRISKGQPRIRAGRNWEYPISWQYTFKTG